MIEDYMLDWEFDLDVVNALITFTSRNNVVSSLV